MAPHSSAPQHVFGVVVLAALTLAGCSRPAAPRGVVLITVDTLRADRLGCYGSKSTRTPHFDRLAAEGTLFEHAVAAMPETRPSHETIFTSLYPREHGVLSNAMAWNDKATTLAATFAAAGYDTAGFAGCALFDAAAGKALGFGHFDAPAKPQRSAGEVVPRALEWLAARSDARPFFLWLHLFDPHMPYEPPPPYNKGSAPEMVRDYPSFAWPRLLAAARAHGGDLPAPVFERAKELYGGEVEYADAWLGRFLDALATAGELDKTVVLLTADHGECFENGVFFDHSQCLGEGALAVPLIVRYPPRVAPGVRVAKVVEHLDVAPTLLRLAGLAVPAAFHGRGLFERRAEEAPDAFFQHPLYRRRDIRERQDVLAQLHSVAGQPTRAIVGDRLQVGARRGGWKYLLEGPQETLYDLTADPEEHVNRAAARPAKLRELRRAVRRWMQANPMAVRDADDLDPALVESLHALGYL